MKLNTVNVMEILGGVPDNIRSFHDTPDGNKQAEYLFTEKLRKAGCKGEDEIQTAIEDGHYESGDYEVYLIHSS